MMFKLNEFVLVCIALFVNSCLSLASVAIIDVCDDITLSFNFRINDLHTVPNGWTYIVGSAGPHAPISVRYPDVWIGEGMTTNNNKPFMHVPIGVGTSQKVLDILDISDGITYNVVIKVTRNQMCVQFNSVNKGCISLPNGHNTGKHITYTKNSAFSFGSVSNVDVESCVKDITTVDICNSINYSFNLNIVGHLPINAWSFVAGSVFKYDVSLLKERISVWINNNGSPYLHFTLGTGNSQVFLNIGGLSKQSYKINVIITSSSMCAVVDPVTGNTQTACVFTNGHVTGSHVQFRKSIGYLSLFRVDQLQVSSECNNCGSFAASSNIVVNNDAINDDMTDDDSHDTVSDQPNAKGLFPMNVGNVNIIFISILVNVLLLGIIFGGIYSKCKSNKTPKYHELSETTTESE